jgi:hypothetical protein
MGQGGRNFLRFVRKKFATRIFNKQMHITDGHMLGQHLLLDMQLHAHGWQKTTP